MALLRSRSRKCVLFKAFVFSVVLCFFGAASATEARLSLDPCVDTKVLLAPWLRVFSDASGNMTVDQVSQLPAADWQPASTQALSPGLSQSALWLELNVTNPSNNACQAWLDMGSSGLRDLRFYRQHGEGWETALGGAAHPFREWTEQVRLPTFAVLLGAGEESRVLVRVASELAIAVQPRLVSSEVLLKARMGESLFDGMLFGSVGLLVFLSLLLVRRLDMPLLTALTMTVFCYCIHYALVTGYGLVYLWPERPDVDLQMVTLSLFLARILAIGYLRTLLQVRLQSPVVRLYLTACQSTMALLGLAATLFPEIAAVQAGGLFDRLLVFATLFGLVLAVAFGWRRGLRYDWFVYLLLVVVLGQGLLGYAVLLGWAPLGPLSYERLSLSSMVGPLLLLYTLVSQVALGRERELQAVADVEQLKQAEQERLEHNVQLRTDQLRESLRSRNLLLARISHDLRSPLQGIINAAQLMRQAKLTPDKGASSIERSALQQLELIDELLEYSLNEVRQLELLIAPGYLFGFLAETQEQARFLAERNDNRLVCDFAEDLPPLVAADFRRLRQVLVNLLANAAKFTRGGEIRLHVSRVPEAPLGQAMLCFAVSDNGVGVAAADLEALQEPLKRGENAQAHEGSGMGLYIVRQMLERMGTQLRIEPLETGGSRFSFLVALDLAHEQELDQIFIESHKPHQEGNGRRVLIVDDVAITREMLYELLTGYDYEALSCSSGEEALELLETQAVELLIVDQMMPGMDGWSLLEQVRARCPTVPVLLYSSAPARRPEHLPAHIDFDAQLQKPADSAAFLAALESLQARGVAN